MAGFMESFRQGRDQARAARGAPPLPRGERDAGQDEWPGESADADRQGPLGVAELEAALRERPELTKRLSGTHKRTN